MKTVTKIRVNLKEYIHPEMDILFLALNAPENSNKNAHWFTNNLSFWNLLFNAGLIIKPISNKLDGDILVFGSNEINYKNWIYGVTDLNRKDVITDSKIVEVNNKDVQRILEILDNHKVGILCIVHSKVAEEFETFNLIQRHCGTLKNGYGFVGNYNETLIFEAPFHNAPISDKQQIYAGLIPSDKVIKPPSEIQAGNTKKKIEKSPISKEIIALSTFIIPSQGNSITATDIKCGQIRVTVDFKEYFPESSCKIEIIINDVSKLVSFTYRDSRSHIIHLGQKLVSDLHLHTGDRLNFKMLEKYKYIIEKL